MVQKDYERFSRGREEMARQRVEKEPVTSTSGIFSLPTALPERKLPYNIVPPNKW
jgi:hypothetical protein